MLDIADSCGSPFRDDLVERGEAVEDVKGVTVVFCLLDRRTVGWVGLRSGSVAGGLESGRAAALRFLDFAGVFAAEFGPGSVRSLSKLVSDSAASLAEERVTLEDMCVNCWSLRWVRHGGF